jgi:MFS transporter, FSR family, fosmidomycin resistance protein
LKKSNNTSQTKFQLGNVLTVSIAHLLHDTFGAFLAPVLPILIEKFSLSLTFSSFLGILQRLPSIINPYIGYLADKIRMRYLIIVSPAITAIAMSLLGIAPTITILILLILTAGFGSALFHVPSPVMVKKVSGNRPGMGMSFYMVGGEIARTLGPVAILSAIDLWTFEGTFRLIPAALVASFLIWLKLRKISIYKDFERKEKKVSAKSSLKDSLGFFKILAFFLFFTSILKSGLTFFLPTYLIQNGETLWYGGIALSTFQFAGAIGTMLSGTVSDFIGRRKTLLLSTIFTPILLLLFIHFSDTYFAFGILFILGIFAFGTTPVILTIVNSKSTENAAFINSIYMTISFLIGSSTVLIVGAFGDLLGLEMAFTINAFAAFAAIPFVWYLK